MKIAQVNYTWDRDLVEPDALLDRYTTLTGWSEALVHAGARVTVVQRFPRRATASRDGVAYVLTPSPTLDMASGRTPTDLAHVNGLTFYGRCWWLRRVLPRRAAIVLQDHGSRPDVGANRAVGHARRAFTRKGLGAADGLLFAAADQADGWRRSGLLPPHLRVYDVMEASTSLRAVPRDAAREKSGLRGSPAVLWVGRLNANKDPLTILSGFERALAHLPGATLTMVYSDDELLTSVRARIQSSPALLDRVRLVGAVPHADLPAFLSAADVFVVGSHHEGSGYSLIEACACGALPVVTDIPSFRAITGNGAVGALWRPGDAGGFARTLVRACEGACEAARGAVVGHFDRTLRWAAVGRRAMEIYREVLARRRGPRGSATGH